MLNEKTKAVKSIDECVQVDPVSKELWAWAENVEKWGKILLYGLIIFGVISSISLGVITDEYGDFDSWSFLLFITNLIDYIFYAFIEYIVYHVVAVLIASLASITQHTTVSAKLAEYRIRKAENNFAEPEEGVKASNSRENNLSKVSQKVNEDKLTGDSWICKACGEKNLSYSLLCKSCGKYR